MAEVAPYEGLEAFVAARGDALLGTAALLMGSRTAGEDLLQAALERVMRRWRHVSGDPEGYLRRTLYHLAVDQWRMRARRPEVFAPIEPPPHLDDHDTDTIHSRQLLIRGLGQLAPRQRAVLVLRYWEGLTEAEAAQVLGCSIGHRQILRLAWSAEITSDRDRMVRQRGPVHPGARP